MLYKEKCVMGLPAAQPQIGKCSRETSPPLRRPLAVLWPQLKTVKFPLPHKSQEDSRDSSDPSHPLFKFSPIPIYFYHLLYFLLFIYAPISLLHSISLNDNLSVQFTFERTLGPNASLTHSVIQK